MMGAGNHSNDLSIEEGEEEAEEDWLGTVVRYVIVLCHSGVVRALI